MRRTTAHDVARTAGVSLATVDRVLNDRPGVRHETRERVRQAIESLAFKPNLGAANLARSRTYRFRFLLPSRATSFAADLARAVKSVPQAFPVDRLDVSIDKLMTEDPAALAAALEQVDPASLDGLAVKATNDPRVKHAIDDLVDRGLPVVTLVSDVPSSKRARFVGIDNVAAGRVAGSLMGRFVGDRPGCIGIIAGSLLILDQADRRTGFEQVIQTEFDHLKTLPVAETSDDHEQVGRAGARLLAERDDLVGLYSISAGNRGIVDALAQAKPDRRPVVILHDLSDISRRALLTGTADAVIDQNVDHEAHSAARVLKALCDGTPIVESLEKIRIDVFLRDNLP